MKELLSVFCAVVVGSISLHAEVVGKAVEYEFEGKIFEGYHAYDGARDDGPRPGILIVHQWTGLSDYEKMRAGELARLGYNVFALDVYGKDVRPQPPESGVLSGKFKADREMFRARLMRGLLILKGDKRTDPKRMAAIGYCFGGTGVLEIARTGADLKGVVSFHGGLGAAEGMQAKLGEVKAKILCLHGAIDPYVKSAEVAAFQEEMNTAKVDYQFISFSGAVHAFTQKMAGEDISKGAAYDARSDERSWKYMMQFFAEIFRSNP